MRNDWFQLLLGIG